MIPAESTIIIEELIELTEMVSDLEMTPETAELFIKERRIQIMEAHDLCDNELTEIENHITNTITIFINH